jgi:hypothetical protein
MTQEMHIERRVAERRKLARRVGMERRVADRRVAQVSLPVGQRGNFDRRAEDWRRAGERRAGSDRRGVA